MADDTSWLDDESWWDEFFDKDDNYTYDPLADVGGDYSGSGIDSFDFSDLFNDDDDYSYLFDSPTDLTPSYTPGVDFSDVYDNLFNDDTDYSYLFDDVTDLTPDFNPGSTDMLSEDYDWSWLDSITGGKGSEKEEPNWLDTILGFVGGKEGKNKAQGIMRNVGGGITDFANSTIGQLLLANYLKNKDKEDRKIPLGAEAYGDQGLGSMPDYRIFNLQPALMPGVGYANAPPPEMKHGGLASLDQGPGDITLARLEPGEFVMTRKATDNIGAKNLYRLMKEAERMA